MIDKTKKYTDCLNGIKKVCSPFPTEQKLIDNRKTLYQRQAELNRAEITLMNRTLEDIAEALNKCIFNTFYERTYEEQQDYYDTLVYINYHLHEYNEDTFPIFANIHDRDSLMDEIVPFFTKNSSLLELMIAKLERELFIYD